MKPHIFLHIGRHKTGTTALQNLFYYNREKLWSDLGIYYPKAGLNRVAHHDIGQLFAAPRIETDADLDNAISQDVVQRLLAEIYSCGAPQVLLSSESFQNANPEHVRALFKGLDVTVIVYLRNQADYLASAYAQQIHGTTLTTPFNRYCLGFLRAARFAHLIRRWSTAFAGNLSVGLYRTSVTSQNGLLLDFLQRHLGLCKLESLDAFDTTSGNRNVSLSAAMTIYKWRLNHRLREDYPEHRQLYFLLMQLSREAPWDQNLVLDRKRALPLWLYCHRENQWVADHYLKQHAVFPFNSVKSAPNSMPGLTRSQHCAISERLCAEIPSMAAYAPDKAFHFGHPW